MIPSQTATGRRMAPGRTGELWVRTPGQLCGYWDDEDETAQEDADAPRDPPPEPSQPR